MSRFMFYVMAMFYVLCALQLSGAAPLPKSSGLSARGSFQYLLPQVTSAASMGAGAPLYTNWLQALRGNSGCVPRPSTCLRRAYFSLGRDVLRRLSNNPPMPTRYGTNARRDPDSPVVTSINGIPIGHGISSFGAGAPILNGGLFSHWWRRFYELVCRTY